MHTIARHGRAEAVSTASPEAVWRVVSDVTRTGEWSHECLGARWLGGARGAAVGVKFRGRNKSGLIRWSRSCSFTVVDPFQELVWVTGGLLGLGDRTEWRIALGPVAGGTRIVQTYDVVYAAPGIDRFYGTFVKAHRDRTEALAGDLRRLAALAAAEDAPEHPAA
jgi:hypothetical protein